MMITSQGLLHSEIMCNHFTHLLNNGDHNLQKNSLPSLKQTIFFLLTSVVSEQPDLLVIFFLMPSLFGLLPNTINAGVPQGSVIFPILFILFVNYLILSTPFTIHSFVDDAFLSSSFSFNTHDYTQGGIPLHRNISASLLTTDLIVIEKWDFLLLRHSSDRGRRGEDKVEHVFRAAGECRE